MADHYTKRIADKLLGEMRANAEVVAARLAPPKVAADGREVGHQEWVDWFREQSHSDPQFLTNQLNEMAPSSVTLPGAPSGGPGKVLRSRIGLENYNAAVEEARPDLVALWHLSQP